MNPAHPSHVLAVALFLAPAGAIHAREFHVATTGHDANRGTKSAPLRTIQRAADLAQPGDVITVHQGVYRERVNPPRGGESDRRRIVYQAARGERVEIKGSEVIQGWTKVQDGVWQVTLPNSFFGEFNPYRDLIHGDWFDRRGRDHHTGAVYVNGDWLIEAARLDEVLAPAGVQPAWLGGDGGYLLNVAWLRTGEPAGATGRIPATAFAAKRGTQNAACSEGGECVGFISHGDWLRYGNVDFGSRAEQVEIRAASATAGGNIELRLDAPEGELLGTCTIPNTGGWQTWSSFRTRIKPMSGVRTLCLVFRDRPSGASRNRPLDAPLWFARVDGTNTTIWAQFKGVNPNEHLVEINVRRTVFYPDKPGRNFITVRGFAMRHAATPWAPPTAEQVGLIGTHWSKGWIIEHNVISHSTCSGIALGKHGDQFDNTSANTAEGYVKTIERAHAHPIPWTRENIGHHVVRQNTISHCEQAGIVGSLGCAFSTVTDNVIHDVHVRRLFSGAEMAGIKFHAAIDAFIARNHIHRTCRGLWLDWMAQGTRVTRNLFHDNGPSEDLFMEVNHGPYLVDNNLFLSPVSLLDVSEGGAFAHNLFAGRMISQPELNRDTPYHPAHSTTVAGLVNTKGGDNRFFNNLFIGPGASPEDAKAGARPRRVSGYGLSVYDPREYPLLTRGNVYFHGAQPNGRETNPTLRPEIDPGLKLVEEGGRFTLQMNAGPELKPVDTELVTTASLGKAKIPALPYVNADGSPLKLDVDFFGAKRNQANPTPGPIERLGAGAISLRVR